jgi:predicted MFS family arabinose efflux permease
LISLWDTSLAFALNAISYTVLIIVLLRWRPQVSLPERTPMLSSVLVGVRFCISTRPVRRVLLRGLAVGFGFAGFQALLPIIVHDRIGGTEIDFGVLLGAFGISSIAAAFFAGAIRRRLGNENVLGLGTLAFIIAQLALAGSTSMHLAIPAALIGGVGWVTALTTLNVAMQVRSPDAILGRCLSIYQAVTFGGMAIGAWCWGAIADWQGLQVALILAAVWLATSLVILRLLAPMPQRGEGVHQHS